MKTNNRPGIPGLSSVHSLREPAMLEFVRSLLKQEKKVRIRVSGDSMVPFLQGGETVILASVCTADLHRGDILLHLTPDNTPLVHRLVRIFRHRQGVFLQTKGDNCASFDVPVPADRILARVEAVIAVDPATGKEVNRDLNRPLLRFRAYTLAGRILVYHYAVSFFQRLFPANNG